MGIFDLDKPLGKLLADVCDLIVLFMFWLMGCLPILTIVTSSTALMTVCGKKVRREEIHLYQDFIKSYKQNFKSSLPLVFILGIFWFSSLFYLMLGWSAITQKTSLAWIFILVIAFELIALSAYILLLFSRFQTSTIQLIKNAVLFTHGYLLKSVWIFLWTIGLSFIVLLIPGLFVLLPGVLACLINHFGGAAINAQLSEQ